MEADILKGHKNALQVTSYEEVDVVLIFFMVNLNIREPEGWCSWTLQWSNLSTNPAPKMKQKSVFLKSYPHSAIKEVLNDIIKEIPSIADIPDCNSTTDKVRF